MFRVYISSRFSSRPCCTDAAIRNNTICGRWFLSLHQEGHRSLWERLWMLLRRFLCCGGGRILTAWFPTRERGTWWGFWTASNNIGGFAAPLVAGGAANHFGWR